MPGLDTAFRVSLFAVCLSGFANVVSAQTVGTQTIFVGSAASSSTVFLNYTQAWTATANDSFLHLSQGSASGLGNALIAFTCDAFTGTGTRNGSLTIAGVNIAVTQVGTNWAAVSPVTTPVQSTAGLNQPSAVAVVDSSGNLYIADYSNNVNRKWTASNHAIAILVPVGPGWGIRPEWRWTPWVTLYYSDQTHNPIGKWTASSQTLSTVVSTGLSGPEGIALDVAGNLYIADRGNNAIKKFSTGGILSTLVSGLSLPVGVSVDLAGNVYFSDTGHNLVKKWTVSAAQVSTLVTSGLSAPFAVPVDGQGNVYIADGGNNAVKKWTAATQTVTTLVSTGLNTPIGLDVDTSGNIYVADGNNNVIKKINVAFESLGMISQTISAATVAGTVQVGFLPANSTAPWSASATTAFWIGFSAANGTGAGTAGDYFHGQHELWVAHRDYHARQRPVAHSEPGGHRLCPGGLGNAGDPAGRIERSGCGRAGKRLHRGWRRTLRVERIQPSRVGAFDSGAAFSLWRGCGRARQRLYRRLRRQRDTDAERFRSVDHTGLRCHARRTGVGRPGKRLHRWHQLQHNRRVERLHPPGVDAGKRVCRAAWSGGRCGRQHLYRGFGQSGG